MPTARAEPVPATEPPPPTAPAGLPLRIAVVTETWPPEVNGVSTTIARVVDGLRQRGHQLQLVRPRQAGEPADDPAPLPGFVEHRVPGLPIPRYPHLRMGLPAAGALQRLWRAAPPDVVHVATEGPLGGSAVTAARRLGLPLSSDFRTNFHAYSRHYGLAWLQRPIVGWLRHVHNRTGVTMVPTEALRAALAADGFERLAVVARGVDTTRFHPGLRSDALRAQWGAGAADPVVLYVGRLAPEKNLALLLRAFDAMREARRGLRLVLVGDGPLRADLQRRRPDAVFAGPRRGDDLAAHYASGDLFVFPSLTETYGNVTPEAMASGLPVLAFDEAAAGELIRHGRSGLLAAPGDAEAFVRLAGRLVADLPAARALGLAARDAVCAQGWDRIVLQIEALMRAQLREAASPAHVPARRALPGAGA